MSDKLNAKDIAAIRERCEKATEGPWKTHLVDDTSVVSLTGTDSCTTCDSSQAEREDGYNIEYERMETGATFIAHARTDIPALLADRDRLVEALQYVLEDAGLVPRATSKCREVVRQALEGSTHD